MVNVISSSASNNGRNADVAILNANNGVGNRNRNHSSQFALWKEPPTRLFFGSPSRKANRQRIVNIFFHKSLVALTL